MATLHNLLTNLYPCCNFDHSVSVRRMVQKSYSHKKKRKKIQCFCNDTAIKLVIGFCFECGVRPIGHIVRGRFYTMHMHTQTLIPVGGGSGERIFTQLLLLLSDHGHGLTVTKTRHSFRKYLICFDMAIDRDWEIELIDVEF